MPARLLAAAVALVLAGCSADRPREPFAKLVDEFIYTSLYNSPVAATQYGYHRHGNIELDSMLDDFSPSSLERQRRWYQDLRLRLQGASDLATLSADDRADLDIIHDQISLALLELQTIQNFRHNPTLYVELVGNALYTPFILEYTDKTKRYEHIIARLQAVPELLLQARRNLSNAPSIWNQVAIGENDGNIALIDQDMRSNAPQLSRARYDEAAAPALEALRSFNDFLKNDLMRRTADWRLGRDKYAQKFRYALATDQTPETTLAAAEQQMQWMRKEMYRIALELNGGKAVPGPEAATIKHVLDRIALKHATPETYFADARRDLQEAREFVRARDLLTLPARDNLQVIETPEFMRGIYSVGGFSSAPPLEPQLGAFYWLTPIPTTWPKERVESKLREYNLYGLKILTIHEAMPGHYVQLEYANNVEPHSRRVLRSVFGNGPYVEGWAVYATELLLEQGYMNHNPEMRLSYLKHLLRVVANTILDVRLQTKEMTDQQALALLMDGAFQEREEATGKLQRAKLSSAQLPTYFVGYRDWMRLRKRMQSEKGAGFSLKQFHESALNAGSVPLPALSRLLTGKPL
ncbi:MAG TPA: DUF885 domain-containing protein [Bryobacteraceae bacterium]|nr:DUF885 domain-containing protein [Bryobacteraceae bacterium]